MGFWAAGVSGGCEVPHGWVWLVGWDGVCKGHPLGAGSLVGLSY